MTFILKNCTKCLYPLEISPKHSIGKPVKCYVCGNIDGGKAPQNLTFTDNTSGLGISGSDKSEGNGEK